MATGLEQTAVNPHNLQSGQARRSVGGLAQTALDPLRRAYEAYQRSIGQPFQQAVRGGVRGYFGLPMMSDADALGREAYRQAEALGYTPGVGMPAGAVRLAAKGVQALPAIAGDIGRVIAGMPSGAGAAQAEDFARYQRSIPPSDVSPLTAFHGTPHRFEPTPANPLGEFRASAIGSGEGAQAYGYGTYFAEAPEVAKGYARSVSEYRGGNSIVEAGGRSVELPIWAADKLEKEGIDSVIQDYLNRAAQAKNLAANSLQPWLYENNAETLEKLASDLTAIRNSGEAPKIRTGSLYTVDIPDEMIGKMLDWDKPLSQQPKLVRQFFEPLVAPIRKAEAQGSGPEWGDFAAPRDYDPLGSELMQLLGRSDQMSAASVLSGGTGGAASSAKLQAAGIPGIRYLDAGSRGGAEGTRNIVVFPGEESKVKILKRE
jgi:hypothetical protein